MTKHKICCFLHEPLVPQEQPSGVQGHVKAPNQEKTSWQNSRTAVDKTVGVPSRTRNRRDYFTFSSATDVHLIRHH